MTDNLLKSFVLVLRQSQGDAGVQCVDCLPLADNIEVLISDRDEYEAAWLTAEGKLADVEAERDRLREALKGLMAHEPDYSDTLWQDAHEVLNGETT